MSSGVGSDAGRPAGVGAVPGAVSPGAVSPGRPVTSDPAARLHALAVELGAMSQNGLNYATDKYDLDRYHRMREITAEVLGLLAGAGPDEFQRALAAEAGHATPKVDVRGVLFDRDQRVLLVREKRDGCWTLPGGWADALDAPTAAVEREFAEEAGLTVRATKLAALLDGSLHNYHAASPWHVYKLFFIVEQAAPGEPVAGLDGETTGVGYFALDDLPELSTRRTTAAQLRRMREHHLDVGLPTDVD